MGKRLFIIIFISIFVVGCTSNQTNNTIIQKEKPYSRKITSEEQGYIKLFLSNDYQTLESQTQNQANEVQKDYNNLAYVMIQYQKALTLEQKNDPQGNAQDLDKIYSALPGIIDQVKYIPTEIRKQVEKVKNDSNDKDKYYLELVNAQNQKYNQLEMEQKAEDRTKNPQSVKIGMTTEEVLTEGWGKPIDINKTTTANGTTEQWVYSGYRYLYFVNGVLVTIQD